MPATPPPNAPLTVSVIVPVRNEEASLSDCLSSLVAQNGVVFEIIVIDDHSTDRTSEIASSFAKSGVKLITAPPLPNGWTGKNNAVAAGATAGGLTRMLQSARFSPRCLLPATVSTSLPSESRTSIFKSPKM